MRIMVAGICIVVVLLGLAQPVAAGSIPAADVLELALEGFRRIVAEGEIANGSLLTIIDYRQASLERRLFVYDPGQGVVLRASLVAHGRNSGQNLATCFGNEPDSRMSSLGFFVTGETYVGRHGYSLRLRGLEPGFNDKAMERFIVIHGADYVSDEFGERYGRLGRSWGCPALPVESARGIIDLIKGGTCLFVYGDDPEYLEDSAYIGRTAR